MVCLPNRELLEMKFTQREIDKVLQFTDLAGSLIGKRKRVVDLCAGNGLCSFSFNYNGLAEKTLMVDLFPPNKFNLLENLFEKRNFNYQYYTRDINSEEFSLNSKEDSIVSIHPCSELGDRVIELSLLSETPFALMPCCHKNKGKKYKLKNPSDPRLMMYEEREDYFDLVRKRYVEEQGWECYWREISKGITEKNHVLIGTPK